MHTSPTFCDDCSPALQAPYGKREGRVRLCDLHAATDDLLGALAHIQKTPTGVASRKAAAWLIANEAIQKDGSTDDGG
jgi:hypothetical protein